MIRFKKKETEGDQPGKKKNKIVMPIYKTPVNGYTCSHICFHFSSQNGYT